MTEQPPFDSDVQYSGPGHDERDPKLLREIFPKILFELQDDKSELDVITKEYQDLDTARRKDLEYDEARLRYLQDKIATIREQTSNYRPPEQ